MSGPDCAADDCRDCLIGAAPILVLAPHPDDETLGCGALLAAAFAGPGAHVVCMSDGAASHPGSAEWPPHRLAALRAEEMRRAVARLGGGPQDVSFLGEPDGGMVRPERFPALASRIAERARRIGAQSIFVTAPTDPHCDHQASAAIARLAAAETGARLFFYPVWSRWAAPDYRDRLGAAPCHRLPAPPARRRKAHALAAHRSQRGKVVRDDADGFVLPRDFIRMFLDQDECFYEVPR
ncbi:PIG-L deacetylase family protein [Roseivivax sp. CAU 1761]